MDTKNPLSPEVIAALSPVLAQTMKLATQALGQSSALAEVLMKKGVLTKAELDAAMKPTADLKESLLKVLDDQIQKQS